jgi:hypothetical protein
MELLMSITRLQKKMKVLELFRKLKDSECQKEIENLSSERLLLDDMLNERNIISHKVHEIDSQLAMQSHEEISAFNLEQKFNYAHLLDQKSKKIEATLKVTQSNISNIEIQLKNILKQEGKINERIEDTKKEINQEIEYKYVSDNR